jgi:anti-anti-sigma factor
MNARTRKTTTEIDDMLHIEAKKDYLLIKFPSTVSMDNYQEIEADIQAALNGKPHRAVVDLGSTSNIYSSGMGLLIRLRKRVMEAGGSLCLVNVSEKCRDLLESVHLERLIPIYATDVEFEISHDDVWESRVREAEVKFVCIDRVENGACRIALSGHMISHMDLSPLEQALPRKDMKYYVLDLTGLDGIDSFGAHLLLKAFRSAREGGGTCVAYGANTAVSDLLAFLSFDDFLACYDNERAALEAIGKV